MDYTNPPQGRKGSQEARYLVDRRLSLPTFRCDHRLLFKSSLLSTDHLVNLIRELRL